MKIRPKFVQKIPSDVEEGYIYISMEYDITAHRCPCGCKNKVDIPLSPSGWTIAHNGSVSIRPSISSSHLRCGSHYWIKDNEVLWCAPLSDEETKMAIKQDLKELKQNSSNKTTGVRRRFRVRNILRFLGLKN